VKQYLKLFLSLFLIKKVKMMKVTVFNSQVLLLTGLVLLNPAFNGFAQEYKHYNTFNKQAELQRFVEQGGKVEEISSDVYRLTHRTGESRTFYLNSKENAFENNEPVDTTIINIWEIDTTKFAGMFTFWQMVEVANTNWASLPIEDLNKNNHPELYGYGNIISPNFGGPVKIFERDIDGIYKEIFEYDSSTVYVKNISDINGTGNKEMFITAIEVDDSIYNYYRVYSADSAGTLPTNFDFIFYYYGFQINHIEFGDWDNNGITDCAFVVGSGGTPRFIIAEFRDSINNFEEIFELITDRDLSNIAIGDFNQDGKTELVVSTGPGNVYVIENVSENEYSLINQFTFPSPNSYRLTVTNDIDGNGKPEFWISGQNHSEGITIYQCYEADDDNSYKPVARIELRYSTSFFNYFIQAVDIDDDGTEELIISSGNIILILKFVGSPNNHHYKLWYAKLGESTQPGAQFYPVSVADLDGDGKKDLLIPFRKYIDPITYAFSYILRQNGTTEVESSGDNNILSKDFIKSYPVPFNSMSSIKFAISKESFVKIKIYNSLGKEIKILLEENLSPGEYNLQWAARDKYGNPLPSGVYLISLQTDNVFKTTKTVFLK
jgi:hypothetical protein